MFVVFCFKPKTADERRISDWSSDVCSSDLLCLDEYTDHGHCGVLDEDGHVDNDATLERYRRIALAQAEAGAHMVGPSGMMDGQVQEIGRASCRERVGQYV